MVQVRAHGIFPAAKPLVTGTLRARVAAVDDPDDLYRVNVPAHSTLTVTMKPDANVNLRLWAEGTRSVSENGNDLHRDLLATSVRPGTQAEAIRWTNTGAKALVVYADVYFPPRSIEPLVNYTLSVRTARARP